MLRLSDKTGQTCVDKTLQICLDVTSKYASNILFKNYYGQLKY